MKKRKKIMVILPLIVVTFLLLLLVISYFGKNSMNDTIENQYKISDRVVEFDNTKIIKNDKLSQEHCLEDICVKDVAIYDIDGEGRIEYTITNKRVVEASDILKLNFGDTFTYISFSALQPDQSISSRTIYRKGNYSDVVDYTLEKLTADELDKIIVK